MGRQQYVKLRLESELFLLELSHKSLMYLCHYMIWITGDKKAGNSEKNVN